MRSAHVAALAASLLPVVLCAAWSRFAVAAWGRLLSVLARCRSRSVLRASVGRAWGRGSSVSFSVAVSRFRRPVPVAWFPFSSFSSCFFLFLFLHFFALFA